MKLEKLEQKVEAPKLLAQAFKAEAQASPKLRPRPTRSNSSNSSRRPRLPKLRPRPTRSTLEKMKASAFNTQVCHFSRGSALHPLSEPPAFYPRHLVITPDSRRLFNFFRQICQLIAAKRRVLNFLMPSFLTQPCHMEGSQRPSSHPLLW
jgi:hypothetical protein